MSMGTIQEKSSGEFKQLVIDDTERLEGQIAHAIPEMTASILIPILCLPICFCGLAYGACFSCFGCFGKCYLL